MILGQIITWWSALADLEKRKTLEEKL